MTNKKILTPFEQELADTVRQVMEYKINVETNIVAILYKSPSEIYSNNLSVKEFSYKAWKTYFQIAYEIIVTEKKSVLDDITVGLYLEKHPEIKVVYEECGGYNTIQMAMGYVNVENLTGYITELRKWNAVIQLCKRGFPVKKKLSEYVNMSAEDIYNELEAFLNHTFVNIDTDVKSYDICHGIYDLIESLDAGIAIGLPYYDMPILSRETGGQYLGAITLLGGISNVGKSTIARSLTIPSIIEKKEKVVIMVNEDSLQKWQREMLVWVCNNVLKFDIQKHTVRDGGFTQLIKSKLYEAAKWLEDRTQNHTITIIPFLQYQTAKAVKEIKKYAAMGVKYFVLDTFKMDAGKVSANSWLEMQQSMVTIKDTVKQESLNVHILITFQLEKGSSVMRYYTQNNIGLAKNIVDVASTCIMVRDVFNDEYDGEKRELKVYKPKGVNGKTKLPVKLENNKKYQLFFITKNQEGQANGYQIVAYHDKSRNIIKEVGITSISPDF